MTIDQVLKETEAKMAKSEASMIHEFEGVRTGKANPALVENVMVDAYGSSMRMRDMAGITVPETRMILIQPWDASTVEAEEPPRRSSIRFRVTATPRPTIGRTADKRLAGAAPLRPPITPTQPLGRSAQSGAAAPCTP